jgi:hypothetical protein
LPRSESGSSLSCPTSNHVIGQHKGNNRATGIGTSVKYRQDNVWWKAPACRPGAQIGYFFQGGARRGEIISYEFWAHTNVPPRPCCFHNSGPMTLEEPGHARGQKRLVSLRPLCLRPSTHRSFQQRPAPGSPASP